MATPAQLTLKPFTEGDTWEGIQVTGITMTNGDPLPSPLALVKMQFRRNPNDATVGGRLSSEIGGGIIIVNAEDYVFNIPARQMRLMQAGTWLWDIQLTDESDVITTYLTGTIEVLPQITR